MSGIRIAVPTVLVGLLALAGTASAANEAITLETSLTPRSGSLFREMRVPVNSTVRVQVQAPPSSPKILPLKRATLTFSRDMTYNPNNQRTPICPDRRLSSQSNLAAGVAAVVDLCPRSVIGTGTANIFLAKVNHPNALIDDPQLVIFNAGRDSNGNAQMKIYGYSEATHSGVLMEGSLAPNGVQDVFVPVLSNDSAVSNFVLNIPGNGIQTADPAAPGGMRTVRGLDPEYVRARCSGGHWTTRGQFTLGERTYPAGISIGPDSIVSSAPFTDHCQGLAGRARIGQVRVNGPARLTRGSRPAFRVTVRNSGTATARNVRIQVSGGGRGQVRAANIAPRSGRTVRVRVRVTGRRGSRARLVFQIRANGASRRVVVRRPVRR